MTKAYQAYSHEFRVTAETPRKAAEQFFENYPAKRKCDVTEGEIDGNFFRVAFGRNASQRYVDVTKKTLVDLPNGDDIPSIPARMR